MDKKIFIIVVIIIVVSVVVFLFKPDVRDEKAEERALFDEIEAFQPPEEEEAGAVVHVWHDVLSNNEVTMQRKEIIFFASYDDAPVDIYEDGRYIHTLEAQSVFDRRMFEAKDHTLVFVPVGSSPADASGSQTLHLVVE